MHVILYTKVLKQIKLDLENSIFTTSKGALGWPLMLKPLSDFIKENIAESPALKMFKDMTTGAVGWSHMWTFPVGWRGTN